LLRAYDAEYVDFYNFGIDKKCLAAAGFLKREPESKITVPNYFEPYVPSNVDLFYAYKRMDGGSRYLMVKGDCDQDRPNAIPKRRHAF